MSRTTRIVAIVCLSLALVLGVSAIWLTLERGRSTGNIAGMVSAVEIGGPFELVDHTGKTVTDADFHGRYMLVYFGYTYCPDVCPTELAVVAQALDALGEAAAQVTPVLITVDPERDTVAILADYVPLFHERLVGLTGSRAQIDQAARGYKAFYKKVEDDGSADYLMDHSSFTYLIGPDGAFVTAFAYGTPPEDIAASIRTHMAGGA